MTATATQVKADIQRLLPDFYNVGHTLGRRWQFIPLPVRLQTTARNANGTPLVLLGRNYVGVWLGQQSASGYVLVGSRNDSCLTVPLNQVRPLHPSTVEGDAA